MQVSGRTSTPTRRRPRRPRLVAATLTLALAGLTLGQVAGQAVAAPAAVGAAAPAPGDQFSGDSLFPRQGNGGYDVSHYDVALAYAASGSITSVATITAATTGGPLSSYSLDLEGLTVSAVTVGGAPATFSRVDTASSDTTLDRHKLIVTPATPVSGAFTTVVTYSGTPIQHTDPDGAKEGWTTTPAGAVALGQPVGTMTWVPCNNQPGDKATWTTKLTIPTIGLANAAVSNGRLVSKVANTTALTTTYTWDQPNPMASELALLAIGNYAATEADVTLAGGRVIQERSYLNSLLAQLPGNQTARTSQVGVINGIQARYGAYPGAATGIVVDATTLGYALETQDRPYFEGTIDTDTLIHEFAHQWFGDSVSPADWNDIWLNEGPATFIATQVARDLDPTSPDTETTYYNLWNSTAATSANWTVPPARMTDPADLFGWQVYNRGAMTLEALRTATCQGVFQQVMAEDQSVNRGTSRPTTDFIARAERISGRDLSAFFQDWIYDADKPAWPSKFALGLTSSPAAGTVDPGSRVTYSLTAANTGKVPMAGKVVTVDVSALSRKASVDNASLPAGVTLTGTTLTWQVPTTAVGSSAATSFAIVVGGAAAGSTLPITARSATLGTCDAPTSTLAVSGTAEPTPTPTPTVTVTVTAAPTTATATQTVTPSATATVTETAPTPTTTVTQGPTSTSTVTVTAPPVTQTATATTTTTVTPTATSTATVTTTVTPTNPSSNRAPTARIAVSPMVVYAGQALRLSAAGSTDPDTGRTGMTYRWDFGDGGSRLDATTATATARYAGRGLRTVRLLVTDAQGASDLTTVPIQVLKRVACEAPAVRRQNLSVVRLARAPGGAYCATPRVTDPGVDVAPTSVRTTFAGSQLRIGYGKRQDGGTADVYVDGKLRGILNFHSASNAISFPAQPRYFGGLGTSGNHTLRIVPTGGSIFLDSFSY